jgi:hypothetical protein
MLNAAARIGAGQEPLNDRGHEVMSDIYMIYRERNGDPAFWAEPFNALSNASFLIAAWFALRLGVRHGVMRGVTAVLIGLGAVIGLGSFAFHTAAGPVTLWLDVIPISTFQVLFLWLAYRRMLGASALQASAVVVTVLVASFALRIFQQPLNGSLFYTPAWLALLVVGTVNAARRAGPEPYLLLSAAGCFTLAIYARSVDWSVSSPLGTHFLWHLINGAVIYLGLRSWVLTVSTGTRTNATRTNVVI